MPTRIHRLLPALIHYFTGAHGGLRFERANLIDWNGLLGVLFHVAKQFLSAFFRPIPLGDIKAGFGLLKALELLYVLKHELFVFQTLTLALEARDGAAVGPRSHRRCFSCSLKGIARCITSTSTRRQCRRP